jgi:hypothetical protein
MHSEHDPPYVCPQAASILRTCACLNVLVRDLFLTIQAAKLCSHYARDVRPRLQPAGFLSILPLISLVHRNLVA